MVAHFLVVTFVISLFLSPAATTSGLQKRWLLGNVVLCIRQPCHNGGSCIIHFPYSEDECQCANGWTGPACDIPINCDKQPCHNGGSCIKQHHNNHECHCANGWTGSTCDKVDCSVKHPCYNGVASMNSNGNCNCHCASGWSGDNCQTDKDECLLNNPCQNGGTCVNIPGSYKCICVNGSAGENCETYNDACLLLKPCQHGGTCSYIQGIVNCTCTSGWKGGQCQTDIDECLTNNFCQHGGTCFNTLGHYSCQCSSGWSGDHCEIDMTPKCNHTCCLDAVILSKPVTSSIATNCTGIGQYASNEALLMECCNITSNGWHNGNTVQENGKCIDGRIPPYTPIAAYDGTFAKDSAGVFYGCIKNGSAGFMMIRQDCRAVPELKNIESDSSANTFFVIY